ncbi:RtcB family protein [Thermosediminibacter litoriperuensis]|uniref:tRNA-splicing ligase RtcB n=1 Tax=Thermosediminibacter litoriperuensis TaxID=291989 RepID=A0A5S5AWX5_9FIRM|nr:RtcB family protein [Thermosediminibacter litoriperuensis]TYP57865.1 tRNA-splicing ligase RtcB [Thermosediminibacter litoriperuensis]
MKGKLKPVCTNCYAFTNPESKVEIHVYLSPGLFQDFGEDEAINQLYNASLLPGVVSPVIGMPDIHTGFGLPIGGVMATDYETGVVSAGAVGMDINCGVRLLTTRIDAGEINEERISKILDAISSRVPSGVGKSSAVKALRKPDLDAVAQIGVEYFIRAGFGRKEDLERIEDRGCIPVGDAAAVPKAARERADQLATIGGGNHFIEIGRVAKVFDQETAARFGLFKGMVYVLIHTGSRGLGHQICTDYSRIMWEHSERNGTRAPVKGLACAPVFSEDGQNYLKAMACAANYAFCNRQLITHFVREAFVEVLKKPESELGLDLLYDVAHNIAKKEKHGGRWLLVHRKGATRALPAGHGDNPPCYRDTGHPAIIPGSMGTASYVLVGLPEIHRTFCSVNHGAGRVMSRKRAKNEFTREQLLEQTKNVVIAAGNLRALLDEAPLAYKDIDEVVFTLVDAGLTKPVVKLKPMGVLKGEGEES